MSLPKISKKTAFTLIEVLVAMLVLAIGLLGLAGITVVVLRSNTLSQQISEATNIASSLMEELRRTSNLPDCVTGNVITSIGTCPPLRESGIAPTDSSQDSSADKTFWPSTNNQTCAVAGLLEGRAGATGTNSHTFDNIAGNFIKRATYSTGETICNIETATSNLVSGGTGSGTLAAGPYVRYYKTIGTGTGGERRIVVVVLFKDRFNKWRSVKFDTRRSN